MQKKSYKKNQIKKVKGKKLKKITYNQLYIQLYCQFYNQIYSYLYNQLRNKFYNQIIDLSYSKITNALANFLIFLLLSICGLIILVGVINFFVEYPTIYRCETKSGIWDKENSICGFLVIYGDNLESRKVLID